MKLMFGNLLLMSLLLTVTANFIENCPHKCKCGIRSGDKIVNCSYGELIEIAKDLSDEIEILMLNGNSLRKTKNGDIRIYHLKELSLRECGLVFIEEMSFNELPLLRELDLSNNSLKTIYANTFKKIIKIEKIDLSHNQITSLTDGLFNNLPVLNHINLNDNRIKEIHVKTFANLPNLKVLKLKKNELKHLEKSTFDALTSISTLDLDDNPWRCDCQLRSIINWVISKKIKTSPRCFEPNNGTTWDQLDSKDFICKPRVLSISYTTKFVTYITNCPLTTFFCEVEGSPLPEVSLILNNSTINEKDNYYGEFKYHIQENNLEIRKWVNVTIPDACEFNNLEYICVAKNTAGDRKINLTISVVADNGHNLLFAGIVTGGALGVTILCCLLQQHLVSKITEEEELHEHPPESTNVVTSENEDGQDGNGLDKDRLDKDELNKDGLDEIRLDKDGLEEDDQTCSTDIKTDIVKNMSPVSVRKGSRISAYL